MRNYSFSLIFILCNLFIGLKDANATFILGGVDYGSSQNFIYCVYYHKQEYCPTAPSSTVTDMTPVTVYSRYVAASSRTAPYVYLTISIDRWRAAGKQIDLEVCLSYKLTAPNRYGETYSCQSSSAVWVNIKSLPNRGWMYQDYMDIDYYGFKEFLPSGFLVSGTYTLNVRSINRTGYKSSTFTIP